MVEKGKDPALENLWTIQLSEADLQLIMNISVSVRNEGNIEVDDR